LFVVNFDFVIEGLTAGMMTGRCLGDYTFVRLDTPLPASTTVENFLN
jgi:hypothetical protein